MSRYRRWRRKRISDFRHRITIQYPDGYEKNEEGIVVPKWADLATVWAAFEPLRSREFFEAAAVNAENTVRFFIRYMPGITQEMRILFDDRVFNITAVMDRADRKAELEIMAKELTNG